MTTTFLALPKKRLAAIALTRKILHDAFILQHKEKTKKTSEVLYLLETRKKKLRKTLDSAEEEPEKTDYKK